jgi:hypothetical protein
MKSFNLRKLLFRYSRLLKLACRARSWVFPHHCQSIARYRCRSHHPRQPHDLAPISSRVVAVAVVDGAIQDCMNVEHQAQEPDFAVN